MGARVYGVGAKVYCILVIIVLLENLLDGTIEVSFEVPNEVPNETLLIFSDLPDPHKALN